MMNDADAVMKSLMDIVENPDDYTLESIESRLRDAAESVCSIDGYELWSTSLEMAANDVADWANQTPVYLGMDEAEKERAMVQEIVVNIVEPVTKGWK